MTGELAAYRERHSADPETGEPGILRDEWRVVAFRGDDPEQYERLREAFGVDWRRYRPFPEAILEHRYIRRGTVEPWEPHDSANTAADAYGQIPQDVVPLAPGLIAIRGKRAQYAAEQAAKAAAEQQEAAIARERAEHKRASNDAFVRLWRSESGHEWAERWNTFVQECINSGRRDTLKDDPRFRVLYDAVMAATTVPAKRKAIRECLAEYASA